ncbi:Reticuline oxidase [Dichotomopilus funicola]|uniref:Reticuline oxidase n=1 Tax=Dichotomopilus funicola TaxID=1934379 RepID=A0AAN6UXS9_9PEZI|nr:Reticuline oxidase [Dichotomopilus funicola]
MHVTTLLVVASFALGALAKGKQSCGCGNAALEHCLTTKGVPFKVKCDSDWADYSTTMNLRLPITPAAITVPRDNKDVSHAVVCASQHGLKVQAKSGGHSYGSYSSGGIDGQVVVDLRHFNKTTLTRDNIAVVGGGVLLGPLATALYKQGKRAVSHGVCGGVGIGGHATHGGWGFTSRAWGLTLDHIVELHVVLANGTETRASPRVNPDLFWALRGGADSIGIVTSFSLRTHPAPEEVVNFNYQIGAATETVNQGVDIFTKLQSFISNATVVDRRTSFALQTHVNPDPATGAYSKMFIVTGTFLGSLAEYNKSIEPEMFRGIPAPTLHDVQSFDWLTSLAHLSPDGSLAGGPLNLAFFANSVTVDDPGINEEALKNYFTYILEGPPPPVPYLSSVELWGGADGQINLADKNDTFAAFPHRNIFWTANNQAGAPNFPFPSEGVPFLNGLRDALLDGLTVPSAGYQNLLDVTLTREEAHALYYGDVVLERLQRVKAAYDPKNIFWNPQSV